ncbi:hypothetical protein TrRE_jg8863 [Triparma retinervis]|uniref:ABC1 atypical kinase-like domain-containing protein n=1 Tax=Triparma retinervis TaxID=2557542 RepID=A0A9W7E2L5_9STRA|nr:hypothetical protein TrRE_jg8863 [Triparma retinervis]
MAARPILKTVGGLTAASLSGGYLWARQTLGSDGVDRIIEEEKKRFEALHHKYAKPLFDVYMSLGGFYYKNGQKIASNMSGVAPKIYQDMFQPFLNDIPARSPSDIRAVVEGELGKAREEVFSTWDDVPIGCASIGQVHRATLKSTGERVVVKVQNPDAERTFVGDVFALKVLVDMFMPQLSPAFDEIEKQFKTEFDYRGEMRNAKEIRENLKKEFPDIIVPYVYDEFCSKKLMVMEEVRPSTPLHDALDEQAERMAKSQGMTKEEFVEKEKVRVEEETLSRALKSTWNWTGGFILPNFDLSNDDVVVPLNAARLIDDLLNVHGHEILIDGVFNADPHPGNVLCADGKLALIDYGQVKRITTKERMDLAKMIVLVEAAVKVDPRTDPNVDPEVHKRARISVAEHGKKIGMKTEKMLEETMYEMCVVYYGRIDSAWLYPYNTIQWTDMMEARDPMGSLDDIEYLVMVNMSSLMLRGLGEMLQQYRNLAECWGPIARKALEKEGKRQEVELEIEGWTKK